MPAKSIIVKKDGRLEVPNDVIIPYIEGDGVGPDIWRAAQPVFDQAVAKAYNGNRKVEWLEVLAGEKANAQTGEWLPQETLQKLLDHKVGIKGPLSTPVGTGIRSDRDAANQSWAIGLISGISFAAVAAITTNGESCIPPTRRPRQRSSRRSLTPISTKIRPCNGVS